MSDFYTRELELAAIWFEKKIQTATEKTARITEGHLLKIVDDQIVDCDDHPTHKVIGCTGTVTSTRLSLVLINLQTGLPETLKVK